MTDDVKTPPGFEPIVNSYSTATKSMQTFASEMQKMSKETVDQTTQLLEKLRSAKSVEDIVAVQTSFMQHSLSSYADYAKRFSELMLAVPMELAKQGQGAFQQSSEAFKSATDQAGEQIKHATDQFRS